MGWDVEGALEGSVPCSRSIFVSWFEVISSCFSKPVPVHTREGRFLTISSGARSRCAARAVRTRWISRVMSVSDDGSNNIRAKVSTGLVPKKC